MSVQQVHKFFFRCDGEDCQANEFTEGIFQRLPEGWVEKTVWEAHYIGFPPVEVRKHFCPRCVKQGLHK